jgi:phosphoribosylanthranilate isomerase
MSVRVKICGITNVRDALTAIEAGADAVGFMFSPSSPRHLTVEQAAAVARALPPFVTKVGVFVDPAEAEVRRAIELAGIDTLQFHGNESPAFCRRFSRRVIKAFRVADETSLVVTKDYRDEAWLLDAFVPGQLGGTGTRFNWAWAAQAVQQNKEATIILAGGLTPENAADAVRQVRPYALDVSSGVESAPGQKDPEKLRRFISAAKSA